MQPIALVNKTKPEPSKQIWLACKILVDLQLDSGLFGNISVRLPDNTFCINPNGITFANLLPDDMVNITIENTTETLKNSHPGAIIHREIYRKREDVQAIVHTHSKHTVLFSLLGCTIEPFTQLGAALYGDQGFYHGFSGPVREAQEGEAIAQALADKSIVIAKNHGIFTTGANLPAALWDMIIVDTAAEIQLAAKQLGLSQAGPLAKAFIKKSKIEVREKQYQIMWENYLRKIKLP